MKVLVLGSSGLVGDHVVRHLRARSVEVVPASRRADGGLRFDLEAPPEDLIARLPAAVTHAVISCGLTNIDACATDPQGSWHINVTQTVKLIEALSAHDVVPVFLSSDLVFAGDRGGYREGDPCDPTTAYGRQKRAVEMALEERMADGALVCRFSKLYCLDPGDPSPVGQVLTALSAGRAVSAADDQVVCPTCVSDVGPALLTLMEAGASGVFHMASHDRMTRYDLALMAARAVGCSVELVQRRSIADFTFVDPRPKDVSLDTSLIRSRFPVRTSSLADNLPLILERRKGQTWH